MRTGELFSGVVVMLCGEACIMAEVLTFEQLKLNWTWHTAAN
jgi:hypothetical protein